MAHEFCWMELTTEDADKAKAFYSDLFGWGYEESQMEQGGVYSMFEPKAGGPGGGIMAKPMPEVPTAWTPYVAVDDLEASVGRVTELGGTVHMGPTPVPGHGAFAIVADPTGGVLGLWRCEK
jgi:predicted enzyme related to lactoylglutathione lyase